MIEIDRFTEGARRALTLANIEARYLVTGAIEPGHLLFGVVQEASELLEELKLPALAPQRIRQRLKQEWAARLQAGPWEAEGIELSEEARVVLVRAQQEAEKAGANAVDLVHLLLALAAMDSLAARVLGEARLSPDQLRQFIPHGGDTPTALER
jgi:ATP-dependent Clp protease ATP-binding subunit ClpA